jgi:hypothetical protein
MSSFSKDCGAGAVFAAIPPSTSSSKRGFPSSGGANTKLSKRTREDSCDDDMRLLFTCEEEGCDFTSTVRDNLKRHMLIHTGGESLHHGHGGGAVFVNQDDIDTKPEDYLLAFTHSSVAAVAASVAAAAAAEASSIYQADIETEEEGPPQQTLEAPPSPMPNHDGGDDFETETEGIAAKSPTTVAASAAEETVTMNATILLPQLSAVDSSSTRPFVCLEEGCVYATTRDSKLQRHMRRHTGEKPCICEVEGCGYTARRGKHLRKHIKTEHSGPEDSMPQQIMVPEKPFKCKEEGCDYAAKRSSAFKVHMRIHTGERPFVCEEEGCDFAATISSNLNTHMRTHTGERPYVCEEVGCDYAATQSGALKNMC